MAVRTGRMYPSNRRRCYLTAVRRSPVKTEMNHQQMAHAPTAHGHMVHDHAGHAHAGHDHSAMIADFRRRFWVSLALTVPVLALSPLVQNLLGLQQILAFPGHSYVLLGLSAVVFFY